MSSYVAVKYARSGVFKNRNKFSHCPRAESRGRTVTPKYESPRFRHGDIDVLREMAHMRRQTWGQADAPHSSFRFFGDGQDKSLSNDQAAQNCLPFLFALPTGAASTQRQESAYLSGIRLACNENRFR
jgi:hypothetical protein